MVLKPIPAAGTAEVGIQGQNIGTVTKAANAERDKTANKMGFAAYGATANMPDPVAYAINRMLDHINALDKQIEIMQKALNDTGINCSKTPLCTLIGCEIADSYVNGEKKTI